MGGQSKANLNEFHEALSEVRFMFINSHTKGLSIFEAMLAYNTAPSILNDLIHNLKQKTAPDSNQHLAKLVKNLEFIKAHLNNADAYNSVLDLKEILLSDIMMTYNINHQTSQHY